MENQNSTHTAVSEDLFQVLSGSAEAFSVLWCATETADFREIFTALAEHAPEDTPVVYIHFGNDRTPLVRAGRAEIFPVELTHRFESFTTAVYRRILEGPQGTLYLFDPLSSLQTAWATDLMMVNFYLVIDAALRRMEARAHIPLLRGMHSDEALRTVRAHAGLSIDLYTDFRDTYARPVDFRENVSAIPEAPFLLKTDPFGFEQILDGVTIGRFRRAFEMSERHAPARHMDSWDRFFTHARDKYEYGEDLEEDCARMVRIMMSRDLRMRELIRTHFTAEDFFFIKEHMVGTGLIGGKACGMLTARKILENLRPELYEQMEAHDSFYIGSDVYYTYLIENDLFDLRVRQRSKEGFFSLADEMRERILKGVFPASIREQLDRLLDYYGNAPIIVRSSSLLEDGFDNAFAGKYESVFCPNTGSRDARLDALMDAIRVVYGSTLSRSALDYRARRGLMDQDEQMALLVQRVSGSYHGPWYMPAAAGVGYSRSPYRMKDHDPNAGMLRLVCGLGSAAVDRTEGSYPRLVNLDRPEATAYVSASDRHRFSQRRIDLIDRERGCVDSVPFEKVLPQLPAELKALVLEHDTDTERIFRERGEMRQILFLSCRGIVRNADLMSAMRGILEELSEVYGQDVDIEFTVNFSPDGDYVINLLQCRPLQVLKDGEQISVPDTDSLRPPFLECVRASMGLSRAVALDAIVYISPAAYYSLPYKDKPAVARLLGAVNWYYREKGKHLLLLVPGRIGTSSPELGVPVTFSEISEFDAIFEIADSTAGYQPELSYGSHIFQDLVEADILYTAVFEDSRTRHFHPEQLLSRENEIPVLFPDADDLKRVVWLIDVSGTGCMLYHDMKSERVLCIL